MLHRFLAAYVRYAAHLVAYLTLAADPYPGFTGRPGSYPIDVEIDPSPGAQNRWVTGLPPVPRVPGDPAGRRADGVRVHRPRAADTARRRRGGDGRVPGLVLLPRARPDGGGPARRWPSTHRLLGAGLRLPVLLHASAIRTAIPASYEFANVYRADPIRADGGRRPAALAAHDLLPPAARGPALRVAAAVGDRRRSSRRSRTGS